MKTGGGKGNKQPEPTFAVICTKRVFLKYMHMHAVKSLFKVYLEAVDLSTKLREILISGSLVLRLLALGHTN
jgi:hypothetical protein